MIEKKETGDDLSWQLLQILDEINTLSVSVEGTEGADRLPSIFRHGDRYIVLRCLEQIGKS